MEKDFNSYLFLIIIIIVFLISTITVLLARVRKKGVGFQLQAQAIDGGNVSVFFDRNNNVTIIPYAKDKFGVGRAVGCPVTIKWPFTAESLGAEVRKSMKACSTGAACSNSQLMAALNYPGWKEFSEGKRNISVHYHAGHGVVMNTTIRKSDGSYQFNHFGFERIVPGDILDKQLGEVLLGLLERCRA